jgi:hypothetical protein
MELAATDLGSRDVDILPALIGDHEAVAPPGDLQPSLDRPGRFLQLGRLFAVAPAIHGGAGFEDARDQLLAREHPVALDTGIGSEAMELGQVSPLKIPLRHWRGS